MRALQKLRSFSYKKKTVVDSSPTFGALWIKIITFLLFINVTKLLLLLLLKLSRIRPTKGKTGYAYKVLKFTQYILGIKMTNKIVWSKVRCMGNLKLTLRIVKKVILIKLSSLVCQELKLFTCGPLTKKAAYP